jgi:hypothetical protein
MSTPSSVAGIESFLRGYLQLPDELARRKLVRAALDEQPIDGESSFTLSL